MKILFTLLFLIILSACSGCLKAPINYPKLTKFEPIERVVLIDFKFSNDEREQIISAVKSWECSTNGILQFTIIDSYDFTYSVNNFNPIVIMKVISDKDEIVAADVYTTQVDKDHPTDGKKRYVVGLYVSAKNDEPNKIMLVANRIANDNYYALSLHELGHAFNLHHNDSRDAVMFRHLDEGAKNITRNDLISFCNEYGCNEKELIICEK